MTNGHSNKIPGKKTCSVNKKGIPDLILVIFMSVYFLDGENIVLYGMML